MKKRPSSRAWFIFQGIGVARHFPLNPSWHRSSINLVFAPTSPLVPTQPSRSSCLTAFSAALYNAEMQPGMITSANPPEFTGRRFHGGGPGACPFEGDSWELKEPKYE